MTLSHALIAGALLLVVGAFAVAALLGRPPRTPVQPAAAKPAEERPAHRVRRPRDAHQSWPPVLLSDSAPELADVEATDRFPARVPAQRAVSDSGRHHRNRDDGTGLDDPTTRVRAVPSRVRPYTAGADQ